MDISPPYDWAALRSWVERDICPVVIALPDNWVFIRGFSGGVDTPFQRSEDPDERLLLLVAVVGKTGLEAWHEFKRIRDT